MGTVLLLDLRRAVLDGAADLRGALGDGEPLPRPDFAHDGGTLTSALA
jgi:hypothetical protein